MQVVDHIVHAKWIISGEANQSVFVDHALIIHQGIIQAIVPSELANQEYSSQNISNYSDHAVMPGLINAHTHIGMQYLRGLGSDRALMDWLTQYVWPAEKKWLSHEFVYDASCLAMAEMIRSGITCFNDMFYFLQATASAAEMSGMRAFIGMTVIEFPTAWAQTTDEYFVKGLEFYEQYKHNAQITPTLAPHAPYTVSDASFRRIKDLSAEHNLLINLHLQETTDEIEQSLQQFNKRPIQRLHDLGLLSDKMLGIHASQLSAEDLDILALTKPSIVHCPESNMKLAAGICPVTTLASRGINVALGTDSVASNNDLDMLSEMRAASFLAKISTYDPLSLTASETIQMATLNGARALSIDHIVGSLVAGKSADFIAINLDEIETLPVYDPAVQVVYSTARNQVTDVWVAGKQLMKNRVLLTLDEQNLKEKARYWGRKISA